MQHKLQDVLIVGGGMVGLTAALAIAEQGFRVRVLEARSLDPEKNYADLQHTLQSDNSRQTDGLAAYDHRVSALTGASEQVLRNLGVWPLMAKLRLAPYTDMDVWDGEGSGHIHFASNDIYEERLGHIVENRVTVAALYRQAAAHKSIELETGVQIQSIGEPVNNSAAVSRILECDKGVRYQAEVVVAADGAQSRLRQMAAVPMTEWDYGHHAITATVRTEFEHQNTAWQCFTQQGPIAFLPLSDPNMCSLVWSTLPDKAGELMALSETDFCYQLAQAFEQKLGSVIGCSQRFSYPLRQRHAKAYVKTSLALIGDAAHTIHPLAGQGVNLGLMDAAALAETLASARQRGESLGQISVLKRYQRARQSANIEMSAAMEGFKRLFESDQPLIKLARGVGMSLVNHSGPVKQHLVMQAMGLNDKGLPVMAQKRQY